jgi:hypothetical protein
VTKDKEHLTDNVVDFVSHVGDDTLEEDREGADMAGRMSCSGGLKAIETTLA